jgi:phage-related protein
MATFPAIPPVHPAPQRTSASSGLLLLGDGYERATQFGLNSIRPEWQLVWEVTAADAGTIEAFLQDRANAGESFDWQPPDAAIAFRWRCDEWNVEQTAFNWYRVSAAFRRVFELSTAPVLTPVTATCVDDALCETDLSTGLGPEVIVEGMLDPNGLNYFYELWTMTIITQTFYGGPCLNYGPAYWTDFRLPLTGFYSTIGTGGLQYTPGPITSYVCESVYSGPDYITRSYTNSSGTFETSDIGGNENFFSQFSTTPITSWSVKVIFAPANPANGISAILFF